MEDITLTGELVRQAPGLAAVAIIVFTFLKAQSQRDALFLDAQVKRDTIWTTTIQQLTEEIKSITQIVVAHDAAMKVTADVLERGQKSNRKK